MIVETEHTIALSQEIRVAPSVACDVPGFKVLAAVNFDDELGSVADKIDDVGADGRLSAETCPLKPVGAHVVPDDAFGIGHVASQSFRVIAQAL
jgi:hypothetical protein